MADDITLKMNVDITDAQSAINLFQKTAEKAFKSSSTSTQSMGNSLTKTTSNIQGLVARMRELENTRIPTQQYTDLQNRVAQLTTRTQEARRELERLGNQRVETYQYTAVTADVQQYRRELEQARIALGRLENQGVQRTDQRWITANNEVQRLFNNLYRAEQLQEQLEASGQRYARNDAYDQQAQRVRIYENVLRSANQQLRIMESTGRGFTSGVNTAEYSRLSQQLAYAVNQGALLRQRISEAGSYAKTLVNTFTSLGTTLSRAVSNATRSLSKLGTTSHSTSLLHNKSWKSMLTMVLKYVFGIRSIFLLYRKIRQVIKTGLTEMSKQFDDVRVDVDNLKNSWSGFKASMVSAFQPIFSYVVPALTTLINYLTSAMNALANFFALLTGQSYYYKAKKGNESVANAISGTGSAAEDANEELAEYDDLLVIDQDSSSGGGGGGSGSSSSDAWNWEKVDVTASKWYDLLKDAFTDWDFTEVGATLSKKLTDALNGINWDSIKTKCSNFAKGLATLLNGFITTDLFSSIGTTLAEALNTAFTTANTFATTFDWKNLGTSIGTGITQFFTDADFGMWGETVHNWIGGILDAGIALLENTDFELIGEKLGDFLEELEIDDLMSKVKTLCSSIITAMGDVLTGFENNTDEKTKLETAIAGLIATLVITGNVPVTLGLAVTLGSVWLGTKAYEILSGNKVEQSFISELTDIAEGLFGEDKIEVDVLDMIDFVLDDLNLSSTISTTFTLGTIIYKNLTGNETYTSPVELIQDLWDGLFSENKIDFNIGECIDFIWDDFWDGIGLTDEQKANIRALFAPATLFGQDGFRISVGDYIAFDGVPDLINSIKAIGTKIKNALDSIWNGQTFSEAMVGANGMSSEAAQNTKYSSGLKEKVQELGKNIHDGIKKGFELQATVTVWTNPILLMYKAINEAFSTEFDSNSPAKKMYPMGENIFMGIIEGFKKAMTSYGWFGLAGDLYNYFKNNMSYGKSSADWSTSIGDVITGSLGKASNMTIKIKTKLTGDAKSKKDIDNLKESFKNLTNETSKSTDAEYKSSVGGQLKTASDIDSWRIKFTNLKSAWTNESSTMSVNTGGQINSIKELTDGNDSWLNRIKSLVTEWKNANGTKAEFKASIGGAGSQLTDISGFSSWAKTINDFRTNWGKSSNASFTATFAKFGSGSDADKANKSKDSFAKDSWSKGATSSFTLKFPDFGAGSEFAKAKEKVQELWNWWDGWEAKMTFKLDFASTDSSGSIKTVMKDLVNQMNNALRRAGSSDTINTTAIDKYLARGGIVKSSTAFIAGEAGTEAVIPLERNLGWMDKMATSITNKIVDMKLPDIVSGSLPTNPEFYKAEQEHNNNVEQLLEALLIAISDRKDMPDFNINIGQREVAKAVWDENEKRYKQLGLT